MIGDRPIAEIPVSGPVRLDPPEGGPDPVNPLAAQLLPERVARHFAILPVSAADGYLTVAVADPRDELGIEVARTLTGQPLRICLAGADEIGRAIDRVYEGLGDYGAFAPGPELDEYAPEPGRLGGILLERGLISADDLTEGLETQDRTGSRLGEILFQEQLIREDDLAAALAEQLQVPHVDPEGIELNPAALAMIPEQIQRAHRCLPIDVDSEALYLLCADILDDEAYAEIREHTELRIRIYLTARSAIDRLLRTVHQDEYVRAARTELLTRFPEDCANRVVTGAQQVFLIACVLAVIAGFVIDPLTTGIVLTTISVTVYAVVSLYKLKLFYDSFGRRRELVITDEEVAAVDERDLPTYTILVPLYKEAGVLPKLVDNLNGLDYPKTKLEVMLLLEEDDTESIEIVEQMGLAPHFKPIIVPDSQPKTKPKACNYGLAQSTGSFIVIYDAEDEPDPDQLKKVFVGFGRSEEDVVCIQCKLNYFNTEQNLLTRFFATEYAQWFDILLPGLDASDAPIPLGGTSNHFDAQVLADLGAWDPFNTTEDADLGLRLHKAGYKTAMLDSTTLEEANSVLPNWIRQRSRWIKGYFQTYLVHMRHPFRLLREIGFRSFLSFQCIIGGTVVFLLNPIFWALTTIWLFTEAGVIEDLFPGFVYYAASFQLFLGNFIFVYLTVAGTLQRGLYSLTRYALFSPLYWGLMSIAAYRGFIQLFTKPFYWEKTEHGLDAGRAHAPGSRPGEGGS